jgi:GntR family transcriptional regulator
MEMQVADEFLASKLSIDVGMPVLMESGVARADGKPAIYSKCKFPYQIFKRMDFNKDSFQIPFFDFLQMYCNLHPDHDQSEVSPIIADEKLARILEVEEGQPLLKMEVISYTIDELPILWSQEYYVPQLIQFTLVRKAPNDFTNQRSR